MLVAEFCGGLYGDRVDLHLGSWDMRHRLCGPNTPTTEQTLVNDGERRSLHTYASSWEDFTTLDSTLHFDRSTRY